jgi:hypothetical protein
LEEIRAGEILNAGVTTSSKRIVANLIDEVEVEVEIRFTSWNLKGTKSRAVDGFLDHANTGNSLSSLCSVQADWVNRSDENVVLNRWFFVGRERRERSSHAKKVSRRNCPSRSS